VRANGPPDREEALARLSNSPLDVLVVGAGITGAGVALDAASRGYRTALVDAGDLGRGTSSRSSKLVHGGLRYLATGDVPMVVEGVRERERTRRMAPHLVRPLAFAVPTGSRAERAQLKAGLVTYDALALGRSVAPHGRLGPDQLRRVAPSLELGATHGGYRYWDCRTDDARLVLAAAQAARRLGALVVPHCSVEQVRTGPGGRVTGAVLRDRLGAGASTDVTARWVVLAGGVWAGRLAELVPGWQPDLTPAKGVHLVFPRHQLPVQHAVVVPSVAGDDRRLFVVPWGGQVYVGTTDAPAGDELATPAVTAADASYLLDAVRAAFTTDVTLDDAVGAWAGLRPLVGSGGASADLSRRHVVADGAPGVLHVTGGKLTTWRAMAEQVVDRMVAADGRRARCVTADLRLGSSGSRRDGAARVRVVAARHGVGPVVAASLHHRHGDLAPMVLEAAAHDEHGLDPLVPGLPYLRGEVRWAVRHELARTVEDVLARRTRVALRDAGAGGDAVEHVSAVLGDELGLDGAALATQVTDYRAAVAHERGPVALT